MHKSIFSPGLGLQVTSGAINPCRSSGFGSLVGAPVETAVGVLPVPVLALVATVVTGTAEHSYSPALSTVTLHSWIPKRASPS